ncbi:hypothetical protein ACODT5_01730 [Streptomyces sp. 5.8]|uniref:hypothetical protein n=1 Tax=Streptomyces sp. 5.8 TaxID=3406571 RepID=UPI003BB74BBF
MSEGRTGPDVRTATSTPAPPDVPTAAGRDSLPAAGPTEFPFTLPRGYVDQRGKTHRTGVMRLATARDELDSLTDIRVRQNPAYLSVVLLSQIITSLGTMEKVDPEVVGSFFAVDLAFLQKFYEKINLDGTPVASTTCPECRHEFDVDMGSRLGG